MEGRFRLLCIPHQFGVFTVLAMSTVYADKKEDEEDYLPQNDEFIPPTNFAVIENGLYRSCLCTSVVISRRFSRKEKFRLSSAFGHSLYPVSLYLFGVMQ